MIREVYSRDRYTISRALTAIRDNDICGFSNMPRNVFRAGIQNRQEELWPRSVANIEVSLLSHLGHKYPDYSFFVVTRTRYFDRDQQYHETMNSTYVFKGEEPLGLIQIGEMHSNNTYGVEFTNSRITNDLNRGEFKKTSKLNVAKSIFAKYFYGLTMRENMEAIAGDVAYEISSTLYNVTRKLRDAENEVSAYFKTEISQGNQPVIQFLADLGRGEMVDNINDARDEKRIVENLEQVIKDKAGYYVVFQGEDYFKWAADESTPKRFKRDEMPSEMRAALGLLRIADKGTFVDGAGFKLADDKFFIRNEVKLEFDD